MSALPTLVRLLRIHGVVQGVGFRQSLRSEAKSLGVAGWVRNRLDGTVEALISGDQAKIEALIQWAHRGPRGARVSRVDVAESSEAINEAGTQGDFLCHPTQ